MKIILLVFVFSVVGILIIPHVLADHDSDQQWGTIYVEPSVLELPYTAADNSQEYEKIKIFGTVEEPRSATWVYFTITEPDGKTSQVKVVATTNGDYENYIQVCCNNIGQYTVYAEWKGYHIGTVTFEIVGKSSTITEGSEVVTQENMQKVPSWVRNIFIWYASEQISEDELLNAIKFLVNQEIINLNE